LAVFLYGIKSIYHPELLLAFKLILASLIQKTIIDFQAFCNLITMMTESPIKL